MQMRLLLVLMLVFPFRLFLSSILLSHDLTHLYRLSKYATRRQIAFHSSIVLNFQSQDPPTYGTDFSKAVREIIRLRYQLLPFLYTLFYKSHAFGGSVIRPLSFK